KRLLAARREYRIAEAELLAVPEPQSSAVCLLVLRPPGRPLAVTALNFGRSEAREEIDLAAVPGVAAGALRGRRVVDALSGAAGEVSAAGRLTVRLGPLAGTTLVVEGP